MKNLAVGVSAPAQVAASVGKGLSGTVSAVWQWALQAEIQSWPQERGKVKHTEEGQHGTAVNLPRRLPLYRSASTPPVMSSSVVTMPARKRARKPANDKASVGLTTRRATFCRWGSGCKGGTCMRYIPWRLSCTTIPRSGGGFVFTN
jgi:hypothetical protein